MNVSLSVFSEWEKILTLYGWLLNNFFTTVLFASGLVLAVIAAVLVSLWLKARTVDHSLHTLQKKLEGRMLVVVCVVLFAFFPTFKIAEVRVLDLSGGCAQYGKRIAFEESAVPEALRQDADSETANVKIPLLWVLIHKIGAGLYYQVYNTLECYTDWRAIETIIRSHKIDDVAIAHEYHQFAAKCYGQARYRYQQQGYRGSGAPPAADDLAYLGGTYYLNTPGYYADFLLPAQLSRWQPNLVRSCRAWWQGEAANTGLREILRDQALQQLPPTEARQILNMGSRDLEDRIIKAMLKSNPSAHLNGLVNGLAAHATNANSAAAPTSGSAPLLPAAGSGLVGVSEQISAAFTTAYLLKRITAYAQPVILWALYLFIPLFLLLTGLSLNGVLYYAMLILSLQAMPMIYVLVAALDAKVTESLYEGLGLFSVTTDRLIVAYVFSYLPAVLAVAYFVALLFAVKGGAAFLGNHSAWAIESPGAARKR